MGPSHAELARTLVCGRLPGVLRVAGVPGPLAVAHATDCVGRPLLLARFGGDVARALGGAGAGTRVAAMLAVDDRPPRPDGPGHGRVRVGGWVRRLRDAAAASGKLA